MSARPLHRLEASTRRSLLAPFVGRRVRLTVDPLRHGEPSAYRFYEGELVALATPTVGTVADLAVVTPRGAALSNGASSWAVSTAQIVEVEAL